MKKEATLMITAELVFIEPLEDEEVLRDGTNELMAKVIKERTDADHVLVTSKKYFVRDSE